MNFSAEVWRKQAPWSININYVTLLHTPPHFMTPYILLVSVYIQVQLTVVRMMHLERESSEILQSHDKTLIYSNYSAEKKYTKRLRHYLSPEHSSFHFAFNYRI